MNGKKAFLDTNLFIYLIEENELYLNKIHNLLQFLEKNGYEIITSTLTLGEILTKPYKDNRLDLVETYKDFFSEMELVELNSEIASLFAKVRADYHIKTPDAVQLASAVYAKADLFVTNDDRLSRFESDVCRKRVFVVSVYSTFDPLAQRIIYHHLTTSSSLSCG